MMHVSMDKDIMMIAWQVERASTVRHPAAVHGMCAVANNLPGWSRSQVIFKNLTLYNNIAIPVRILLGVP